MPQSPKDVFERIQTFTSAWETLRPTKSFGGMTLVQFKAKVQPSRDARDALATLEQQMTAAQDKRDAADEVTMKTIQLVVNGVRADPDEGEDGEFYDALGYVRKSERKSGLRRGAKPADPAK